MLERVHRQFLANLAQAGIVPRHEHFTLEQLEQGLSQGRLPLVLISTYHLDGRKAPHWVLVCAMDREFVYIHDPDIDEATGRARWTNSTCPLPAPASIAWPVTASMACAPWYGWPNPEHGSGVVGQLWSPHFQEKRNNPYKTAC
ncbi:peptidase C39 family protein [Oceanimonas sp. NS1]|nr:peptidase C39 family protein [Oceanimonas sp. NS1]